MGRGAIKINSDFNVSILNCTFENCSSKYSRSFGGAICSLSNLSIYDSTFVGNYATWGGGAVYGSNNIINCTFIKNRAYRSGAALWTGGIITVEDCIF